MGHMQWLGVAASAMALACGADFEAAPMEFASASGSGSPSAGMGGLGSGGMGGAPTYEGPAYIVPGGNGAFVRGFSGPLSDLTVGVEAQYAGADYRLEVVLLTVPDGPGDFDEITHEVDAPLEVVVERARPDLGGRPGQTTSNYQVSADTVIELWISRAPSTGSGAHLDVPPEDISRLWINRGTGDEIVAEWP